MVEIFKGGIPVIETLNRWYEDNKNSNFGAMIPFIGIVREEKRSDWLFGTRPNVLNRL